MSENNRRFQSVFLVGVKHTGKSRVARLVAARMSLRSLDIDERVGQMYASESARWLTVREIYQLDGGDTFRRLETAACARAARTDYPVVVATGGGLCDNSEAVAELRSGLIVALQTDAEVLFDRIMTNGIPAFMTAKTRAQAWIEFTELYGRRSGLYRDICDVLVEVSDRRPQEVAAEVIIRIEERTHGGK